MDELLAAAFEPVARDLRAAGLEAELTEDSTGLRDEFLRADLIVSGVKLGHVLVDPHQDAARRVHALADFVQDLVQENIRSFGGRTVEWPACLPSHAHPMTAGVIDGVATWYCPRDPAIAVEVGSHP